MDLYTFSLALGGVGMASMAVTGLARGHGGHAAGARHGHHGAQHGHHHTAHGHVHGHAHTMHAARETASRALWTLISPRVLFSALVGFGATGLLARGVLGGAPLFLAAVAGGAVFERLLVTPLWNVSLRFASAPALSRESG